MVTLEKKSGATARLPHRVAEDAAVAAVEVRGEPVQHHQHRHQPQDKRPPRLLQQERAVAQVAPRLHLVALRIGLGMQHIRPASW